MLVSQTVFKTNLDKYLDMLSYEDITITRNGRKIARVTKEADNAAEIRSLFGILSNTEMSSMTDVEIEKIIHEERGKRYERVD